MVRAAITLRHVPGVSRIFTFSSSRQILIFKKLRPSALKFSPFAASALSIVGDNLRIIAKSFARDCKHNVHSCDHEVVLKKNLPLKVIERADNARNLVTADM